MIFAAVGICALWTLLSYMFLRSYCKPAIVGQTFLLVIAHPDDECMFFTPTIRWLVSQRVRGHILCLSTGSFEYDGSIRRRELLASAKILGIPPSRVYVIDDSNLRDGPAEAWDDAIVAKYVENICSENDIDLLVTFDARGVSDHPNHIAAHHGVRKFFLSGILMHRHPRTLVCLESTALLRKYIAWGDHLISLLLTNLQLQSFPILLQNLLPASPSYCIIDRRALRISHRCMVAHQSQYVWFRRLFVALSRYSTVNTLQSYRLPPTANVQDPGYLGESFETRND